MNWHGALVHVACCVHGLQKGCWFFIFWYHNRVFSSLHKSISPSLSLCKFSLCEFYTIQLAAVNVNAACTKPWSLSTQSAIVGMCITCKLICLSCACCLCVYAFLVFRHLHSCISSWRPLSHPIECWLHLPARNDGWQCTFDCLFSVSHQFPLRACVRKHQFICVSVRNFVCMQFRFSQTNTWESKRVTIACFFLLNAIFYLFVLWAAAIHANLPWWILSINCIKFLGVHSFHSLIFCLIVPILL